jgi:ABC-type multidrug transport system ATPase subunit
VFFLDEPTSGLDPSTSADLIAHLRKLADHTATVVFTTHSVDDLRACDRVVFMARGGHVAFVGPVDAALDTSRSIRSPTSSVASRRRRRDAAAARRRRIDERDRHSRRAAAPVAGALTQWAVLTPTLRGDVRSATP